MRAPVTLPETIEAFFGSIEEAGKVAFFGLSYYGVCYSCLDIDTGAVEPDARCYPCGACGESAVHGLEEALVDAISMLDAAEGKGL